MLTNHKLILSFILFCSLNTNVKAQTGRFSLSDWQIQAGTHSNMLPMYGKKPKTETELLADKEFLESMGSGSSHKDRRYRSDRAAEEGWLNYYSGALDTAMFRFNQAWLIDSANIASYIGFAAVYSTLGDQATADKMFVLAEKYDSISLSEYHALIDQNIARFRKLESQSYKVLSEYKPVQYYATGQLYIERKKTGKEYNYKSYYENGRLLRQVNGGENSQNWKGEVISYHDNGVIAHKGKWEHSPFKPSIWTSYDREGKVSEIEYWKKSFLRSNYTHTKTIVYSQEIPWKKGSYQVISKSGWIKGQPEPDGYIQEVYNGKDPLYKYYAVWKDGKRSNDLIKTIPEDCDIRTADGDFEWFEGKLYKIR